MLYHPKTIQFDPSKREHREAVRDFMRRKHWGDTNLRFSYDPTYGSISQQIQEKLLSWYIFKEESRREKVAKG